MNFPIFNRRAVSPAIEAATGALMLQQVGGPVSVGSLAFLSDTRTAKRMGRKGIPVDIDGKKFASMRDACNAYGVSHHVIKRWLAKGGVSRPVENKAGHRVKVDGVVYPSQKAAARALGLSPSAIRGRIDAGKAKILEGVE